MRIRDTACRDTRTALTGAGQELRRRRTRSEELLWDALRDRRLDGRKFRRQSRVGHFVVDFYCASERLVLEVDGGVHAIEHESDSERQRMIEELGLRVMRIAAEDVERNMGEPLESIRTCLTPATASPLPRLPRERGPGGEGE